MKKNIAIILAGGTGNRFGSSVPKQFAKLAGKTIIEHTIKKFDEHLLIDEICIVIKKEWVWKIEEIVISQKFKKVKKIISGGNERKDSSLSAIKAYENESDDINLIFHDAVRPFIDNKTIDKCIDALKDFNAVDVAIPATDTIIKTKKSLIQKIPKRSQMMQGQTPQCFKLSTIHQAYKNAEIDPNFEATDDCGIVRKYLSDEAIYVVTGSLDNIKITHSQDIFLADKLFQLNNLKETQQYSEEFYKNNLNSKVIVVFGGNSGIGKNIIEISKQYGAKTYSFSRSNDVDISSLSSVKKSLSNVYKREGQIDYVVNSAAILAKEPLVHMDYDKVLDSIHVNYIGAVNIAKESIPYLEKTSGQLLNFTSSSYTRGRANYSVYSSTKAAIVNLTQALGEELYTKNIRVNCINPQRTATPMRISNFGYEEPSTLLCAKTVAYISINTLINDFTGQIVDVRLEEKN